MVTLLLPLLFTLGVHAENGALTLCDPTEIVAFSFRVKGERIVSLCEGSEPGHLIYRYGRAEAPELIFPEDLTDSYGLFRYRAIYRDGERGGGLEAVQLEFVHKNFRYAVYQEFDEAGVALRAGLLIKNLKSGREFHIPAVAESMKGSLLELEDRVPAGE
jgi:hypothetical protein